LRIEFTRLEENAQAPRYARIGDAGADITTTQAISIPPLSRKIAGTGVAIALPDGYAAFIHPRSGLAANKGVTVLNAPGTIDSGYRGEVKVVLVNHSERWVGIAAGERIAQLVVQRYEQVSWHEVSNEHFDWETERGNNGFGSTGTTSI